MEAWHAPEAASDRRARPSTGASAAFARAIAASLPGVVESRDRDETSFAVRDEVFLSVEDGDLALLWSGPDSEERLALLTLGRDALRERIERAWAAYASPSAVTAYKRKRARWAGQPAVSCDDMRRVIAGLPGANEGPIWGQDLGFRVGDEKRTRFARFGPPEGSKIGNLLPPDDENALVIFHCETKPALLREHADRFFTTPHYGSSDEPGGVITRLSENRGKDDLAELAKLLEAAWRRVAAPEGVAKRKAPTKPKRKKS
jgi:hypothetical protein